MGQIFDLILSFVSSKWLWVVAYGNSSQEYLVNVAVPQGSIPGPTFFLLYINDLAEDVMCCDLCRWCYTLYSKSGIWSVATTSIGLKLESDVWDTGLGQKMTCWVHCWKNSTFLFDWSYSIGAMDVKMDGCVFEKNRLSRCWQCHIQMFFGHTV